MNVFNSKPLCESPTVKWTYREMTAKTREELLDLIPAYALGALDDAERDELEDWLKHDPEAQAVLVEYRAVAGHLVGLVPLRRAPDHLAGDLRQRLASTRGGTTSPEPARRVFKRRWVWAAAAAALLAAVVLGIVLTPSDPPEDPAARADALYDRLVAQPGSSLYLVEAGEVNAAVSGDIVISADGKQAVLCMRGLPEITEEQAFQMWLIDASGARTSGGVFQGLGAHEDFYIEVPLDQPDITYQAVGVSLEPAGGSPYADRPSGPRVLSVKLG